MLCSMWELNTPPFVSFVLIVINTNVHMCICIDSTYLCIPYIHFIFQVLINNLRILNFTASMPCVLIAGIHFSTWQNRNQSIGVQTANSAGFNSYRMAVAAESICVVRVTVSVQRCLANGSRCAPYIPHNRPSFTKVCQRVWRGCPYRHRRRCFVFFFLSTVHSSDGQAYCLEKCILQKKYIIKIPSAFQSRIGLGVCDLWNWGQACVWGVVGGSVREWRNLQTVMYVYREQRAADAQKSVLQSPLKLGLWAKCRQNCCDARDCIVCAQRHSLKMRVLVVCSKVEPLLLNTFCFFAVLVLAGKEMTFKVRRGARDSPLLLSWPNINTANSGDGKVFPRTRAAVCKNMRQLF